MVEGGQVEKLEMVSDDQAGIDRVRDRGWRVTDARMPVAATETNEQTGWRNVS